MGNYSGNQNNENYSEGIIEQKEWIERNLRGEEVDNLEIETIENTPFRIAGLKNGNEGWKVLCGNQIASYQLFKTKEAAKRYVKKIPWDLMVVMAVEIYNAERKSEKIKEGE